MIEGFEKQTTGLNREEIIYLKKMVPFLSRKIGKRNAVSATTIINGMKKTYGLNMSGARLRKIIRVIRINGIIKRLVASSEGYYVETNNDRLRSYINNSLRERAASINALADALEAQI